MHEMKEITEQSSRNPQVDLHRTNRDRAVRILCPYSKEELEVNNCYNCSYCQIMKGEHKSGRSLTSLICLYGLENEGDSK